MLDQPDYERLIAIQKEMQDLLEEAKNLVRLSGDKHEYERAKAYWLGYIENALEDAKSPFLMCTMGDTIDALDPGDESDDDEDLENECDECGASGDDPCAPDCKLQSHKDTE